MCVRLFDIVVPYISKLQVMRHFPPAAAAARLLLGHPRILPSQGVNFLLAQRDTFMKCLSLVSPTIYLHPLDS